MKPTPLFLMALGGPVLLAVGRLVPGAESLAVIGAWIGLVMGPGTALALTAAPGESTWLTLARAAFLGPLFGGAVGVALLLAGLPVSAAAWITLGLGSLMGMVAGSRTGGSRGWDSTWEKRLVFWMITLALLVLVPFVLREWVRVRSDAVFHSAVALEIAARGLPPQDPYFADLPLNYTWFYQALVALWATVAGTAPWNTAGLLNAGWLAGLAAAVFAFSRRTGRSEGQSFFAALFVPLGLSAVFALWLPLKFVRGLVGETGGWEHVTHLLGLTPFTWDRLHQVQSTWESPPPLVNKYLLMTAWGGAVTSLAWLLEAIAALAAAPLRQSAPRMSGLLLAAAAYGAWVLHPAMGLYVSVGGVLAVLTLLLWPGDLPRSLALRVAGFFVLGSAPAWMLIVVSAARAEGGVPLGVDPHAVRGVLVGCTAALLLGIPGLRRLPAGAGATLVRILAFAFVLASVVVVLPPPNTIDKAAFVAYLVPAMAAGWFLGSLWESDRRRGLLTAVMAVILVPVNLLFVLVLLVEPGEPSPGPAERDLYRWIGAHTNSRTVVLDTAERDDILLRVPRRQYWGREPYARQWGYPVDEMDKRRSVRDAWVSPELATVVSPADRRRACDTLLDFARDTGDSVLLVLRPGDFPEGLPPDPGDYGFTRRWENAAATVYSLTP